MNIQRESSEVRDIAKNNRKLRVLWTAATLSIFYLCLGCLTSYPAPAVPNINDNRNPFHVTRNEQSWIGSISFLGLAIGGLVSGSMSDALGRKLTIIVSALASIVGLTIVSAATNARIVSVGLFIGGVFEIVAVVSVIMYVSEVATEDNRGFVVSLCPLSQVFGQVVVFAVGSYLPWNWLAIFIAALHVVPTLVLVFLPESPRWFLLKGNAEAAAHGLRWFRGDHASIDHEMEVIAKSVVGAPNGIVNVWKDLVQKQNAKHICMCCGLLVVQAFSGNCILTVFTVTIFQLAKVDISPNLESVVTGLFSLVGGVVCTFLIERCGRRRLLLVSTVGMAFSTSLVAVYFQIHESNAAYAAQYLFWLPMVAISLSNFMFSLGLASVPSILNCELFSTNVRGFVMNLFSFVSSMLGFTVTKTFMSIQAALNTSGAFWFYSACSVVGVVFIVFVVREPRCKVLA